MKNQDTEIKNTKQIIELVKMYILAQTNDEKSRCIAEIQKLNPDAPAMLQKYTANELQTRLKHAIYKDDFRPKNISIVSFAADENMEYINGEFSTFDIKLSKAAKSTTNPTDIQKQLQQGVKQLNTMSKLFTQDWIETLSGFKNIIHDLKNEKDEDLFFETEILLEMLTYDFCEKHDCDIDIKFVDDWNKNEHQPPFRSGKNLGMCVSGYAAEDDTPDNIDINSLSDKKIISVVYINLKTIKESYGDDFVHHAIATLAHELNHALEVQHPNKTALGAQIKNLDSNINGKHPGNKEVYMSSVSEIYAKKIGHELIEQLKQHDF